LLYIVFVAALVAGYNTWRAEQRHVGYAQAVAEFKAQADRADAKREVVTQYVDREVVKTVRQIQLVTQTITKEVPVYVPSDSCTLPGGYRVLHDAAARGEVPQPTAGADAAPVAAQDAASTTVDNYGACRKNAASLTALQLWINQQQSLN
jgi:hypothetical protein